MQQDNQPLAGYLKEIAFIADKNITLFEALQELKEALLSNGAGITGNHNNLYADEAYNVTRAYSTFVKHLTLLEPDENCKRTLCDNIKSDRFSLSDILADLLNINNNAICIETQANRIQALLDNVSNKKNLQRKANLNPKDARDSIRALNKTNPSLLIRQANQAIFRQLLPEYYLTKVVESIPPIRSHYTLFELIKILGSKAAITCLLKQRWENIKNLFSTPLFFKCLFIYLPSPLVTVLLHCLSDCLTQIFADGIYFHKEQANLTVDQLKVIFSAIDDNPKNWIAIIKNSEQLQFVLQHLTNDQCQRLCDAISSNPKNWMSVITSMYKLSNLLSHLTVVDVCQLLCKAIISDSHSWIKINNNNPSYFVYLMKNLTEDRRQIVIHTINSNAKNWAPVITSIDKLFDLLPDLTPDEWQLVCESIISDLHVWTQVNNNSSLAFIFSMKKLIEDQRQTIINVINSNPENWIPVIRSNSVLCYILQLLTIKQCQSLCDTISSKQEGWAHIFAYKFGAGYLPLEKLTVDKRQIAIKAISSRPENWVSVIKTGSDLQFILKNSPPDESPVIFNAINTNPKNWMSLIYGPHQLIAALEFLIKDQCRIVCNALSKDPENWRKIIVHCTCLHLVLEKLTKDKREVVTEITFEIIKDWNALIENFCSLIYVLEYLTTLDQCKTVCDSISKEANNWEKVIKNHKELTDVLKRLTADQCRVVCHACNNHSESWTRIVTSVHELRYVLANLDPKQRQAVCETFAHDNQKRYSELVKQLYDINYGHFIRADIIFGFFRPNSSSDFHKTLQKRAKDKPNGASAKTGKLLGIA